jgi:hypothetical protein
MRAIPGGRMTEPGDVPAAADSPEAKRQKKELRRLEDATRPLDSWERYRALNDTMDEAYELVGIANREARFAAILMGALNTGVIVLVTRGEIHAAIPPPLRSWVGAVLGVYAFVAVYFFLSAIEILRPRRFRPRLPAGIQDSERPVGVRYYEDIVLRAPEAHLAAWRSIHIGQLNAELAAQTHSLALVNQAKYAALRRLYAGLRVMTLILAAVVIAIAFFAFGRGLFAF